MGVQGVQVGGLSWESRRRRAEVGSSRDTVHGRSSSGWLAFHPALPAPGTSSARGNRASVRAKSAGSAGNPCASARPLMEMARAPENAASVLRARVVGTVRGSES